MLILRLVILLLGMALSLRTLLSAIRTFVLPRGAADQQSRAVFTVMRLLIRPWVSSRRSYLQRDGVMALYAPVSLLVLLIVWLTLIMTGYAMIFWALGVHPWRDALTISGSSLLTLGFAQGHTVATLLLSFSEAAVGLIMVAVLIAYLPTMYSAFARREAAVTMLEVRAGSPPSAVEMLLRFKRLNRVDHMHEVWESWEGWFADVEESHTSLAALAFFRSPQPDHSWVTASGAVLDAAALTSSTLDMPRDAQVELCLRAGYLCLQRIADFFQIQHNPTPKPDDPIRVSREEFLAVRARLADGGLAVKADQEQSWRDFSGWRVNYDTVLLALARMTVAPPAPWSSVRMLSEPGPRIESTSSERLRSPQEQ